MPIARVISTTGSAAWQWNSEPKSTLGGWGL